MGINDTATAFKPLFAPWNMQILFALYMHGPHRFSEIKGRLKDVSSRVLTDKLRHLEQHGLVRREAETRATTYEATAHGHAVARHLHPLVFRLHHPAMANA